MRSDRNADYELNLIKSQSQDLISTLEVLLDGFYEDADRGFGHEAMQAADGIEDLIEGVEKIHDQVRYYYRSF